MKSERRLSKTFGAVCACAQRAIERSAVGGVPKRGAAAHINARHLLKNMKRRAKAQSQPL